MGQQIFSPLILRLVSWKWVKGLLLKTALRILSRNLNCTGLKLTADRQGFSSVIPEICKESNPLVPVFARIFGESWNIGGNRQAKFIVFANIYFKNCVPLNLPDMLAAVFALHLLVLTFNSGTKLKPTCTKIRRIKVQTCCSQFADFCSEWKKGCVKYNSDRRPSCLNK